MQLPLSALHIFNATIPTLGISPYLQNILKQPVESADAIYRRQAAQPFNNDYDGPFWTSPPSYPSPWGSGLGDWGAAYEKAHAFVSQLTLLEKVNLTTGIGYVTYSCPSVDPPNSDFLPAGNLDVVLETSEQFHV